MGSSTTKPRTERAVTAAIIRSLKARKAAGERVNWLKLHGSACQRSGEPDLLIVHEGRPVLVEIKRPSGSHPTPLQVVRLKAWRSAGAICGVARSVEDVDWLLDVATT